MQFMQTKNLHKGLLALIAIVGALALYSAGIWSARRDVTLDGSLLYLARFSQVAVYFFVAYLFRNHIPSVNRILVAGIAVFGLHIFLEALLLNVPVTHSLPVFGILSHVFSGAANACILLLIAHVFSSFNPKLSIPAFAVGFLLAEILYTVAALIPESAVAGWQFGLKTSGICLILISIYCKNNHALEVNEHPLQYGLSCDYTQREQPLKFLANTTDWVFQIITAALIPFIFGFMSQLMSVGDTRTGLHDVVSEAFTIIVLAVLSVYCFIRKSKLGFNDLFIPVILLFATGLATLPILWEASSPFAGSLLKSGMEVYQAMIWMLLACKSFEDPRHTYLYFGVFLGFANVSYGRFAEPLILGNVPLDIALLSNISLLFMWLLLVLCLVLFVLQRTTYAQKSSASAVISQDADGFVLPKDSSKAADGRWNEKTDDSLNQEKGESSEPLGTSGDPFVVGIDTLTERCSLTRREREVLIEIMHGYSMPNVAKKLYISPETVRTHMKNIYRKTDTSNKQSLIHMIDALGKGDKA